jgi:hypothetical protein
MQGNGQDEEHEAPAHSTQSLIRSPSLESFSEHGSDVEDSNREDIRLGLLSRKTRNRVETVGTETGNDNRLLILGILREVSILDEVHFMSLS